MIIAFKPGARLSIVNYYAKIRKKEVVFRRNTICGLNASTCVQGFGQRTAWRSWRPGNVRARPYAGLGDFFVHIS